ncbi:hypothetical protein BKA82DRAFT_825283 [Pisolithus tinctorius]|nr:hypothetical protein BKA82DRAFT_825283 [Pisolithus tinctorius]
MHHVASISWGEEIESCTQIILDLLFAEGTSKQKHRKDSTSDETFRRLVLCHCLPDRINLPPPRQCSNPTTSLCSTRNIGEGIRVVSIQSSVYSRSSYIAGSTGEDAVSVSMHHVFLYHLLSLPICRRTCLVNRVPHKVASEQRRTIAGQEERAGLLHFQWHWVSTASNVTAVCSAWCSLCHARFCICHTYACFQVLEMRPVSNVRNMFRIHVRVQEICTWREFGTVIEASSGIELRRHTEQV